MRISDWSSDVCSSDLSWSRRAAFMVMALVVPVLANGLRAFGTIYAAHITSVEQATGYDHIVYGWIFFGLVMAAVLAIGRSEEHTSELQSLMRISYALFCLKKKKTLPKIHTTSHHRNSDSTPTRTHTDNHKHYHTHITRNT